MPILLININGKTIGSMPMDSLKKALKYVEELPINLEIDETFIYKTVNEETRIDNTVEIKKRKLTFRHD